MARKMRTVTCPVCETGPYRDIVLFNAAAALVAGGHEENLQDAVKRATARLMTVTDAPLWTSFCHHQQLKAFVEIPYG